MSEFLFKKKNITSSLLIFFLSAPMLTAQTKKIDSLRNRLHILETRDTNNDLDTTYILMHSTIAREFQYVNLDSLLFYANKGLQFSKESDFTKGIAASLSTVGLYYILNGDYQKGLEDNARALKLAKDIAYGPVILKSLNTIALAYNRTANYPDAYKTYLEALEMCKLYEDDLVSEATISMNIGVIFSFLKEFEQSLFYFDRALETQVFKRSSFSKKMIFANIGYSQLYLGNYNEALENVEKAIPYFEKNEISAWLAFANVTKASIYLEQEKFEQALDYFKKAERIHQKINDKKGFIDTKIGLSKIHYKLGKSNSGIALAKESMKLSQEIKYPDGILECNNLLYLHYKSKNNISLALQHFEAYKAIADSLLAVKNKIGVQMLNAKMEFDIEKASLAIKNEEKLARQRKYTYFFLGLLAIFLIFSIVLVYVLRLNRKTNIKLLESNTTKDTLFSIIAHDLKAPINSIRSLLELRHSDAITDEQFLGFIPKLRHDVKNVHFTLDNLLIWASTQLSRINTNPVPIHLLEITHENIELYQIIADKKSIKINTDIPLKTKIYADRDQLNIVFRNLISNAVKFTDNHGSVSVSAVETKDGITIQVKDSGKGMSQKDISKVLQKQGGYSTYGTNGEKGTGIGLSLCKKIISQNKGVLWIESEKNKGTTCFFTLPKAV